MFGVHSTEELPHGSEVLPVEAEYERCIQVLNKAGIISLLPREESLGVIGIDGKEYAIPTGEQVADLLDRNRELVKKKKEQGFTRLQLTPFALPLTILTDRVKALVLRHHEEGKIFQAKRDPKDYGCTGRG